MLLIVNNTQVIESTETLLIKALEDIQKECVSCPKGFEEAALGLFCIKITHVLKQIEMRNDD